MRRAIPGVLALLLLASGCAAQTPTATPTPEPRTTPAASGCSATDLSAELTDRAGEVPSSVRITRQAIAEAAVACDYERLEEVASSNSDFTYSLDEPSRVEDEDWDPAGWWMAQEADGIPVLATMIRVLEMRPALGEVKVGSQVIRVHVFPRAFQPGDTVDSDWDDVKKIHPPTQADEWRRQGVYHGWRLGIAEDEGHWIFSVTGECADATSRPLDPRVCPATAERPAS